MKFSIEREKLIQALEPVTKVATKVSSMEIINHCLITAGDGQVSVKGTNMETFVTEITEADVQEAGACTADGRMLLAILKADKSENVSLEKAASDTLKLGSDSARATLRTLDAEQYPVFDENINYWFDTTPEQFSRDISCVLIAAEVKETRPQLQTVFVETRDGNLMLSACDRKIMARLTREMVAEIKQAMIPRSFLKVLPGMLKGESVVVGTSGENENLVCFHTDESHISSRVYEGEFPDLDSLLNPFSQNHSASFNFDRKEMEAAIKLMIPMGSKLDRPVLKVRLDGGVLHLAHKGNNGDTLVTQLEVADKGGEDFAVCIDLTYASKMLTCFAQHDNIHVGYTQERSPVYFQNADETVVTQVVLMPIANVDWMEDIG